MILRALEASTGFDWLRAIRPSARGKGKDSFWGTENNFLRNAGFYLNVRNPTVVQFEIVSGYLGCLTPNKSGFRNMGGLEEAASHQSRGGIPLNVFSHRVVCAQGLSKSSLDGIFIHRNTTFSFLV